jgi:outer membrane protein assembly complex protein YaeT
MRLRSQTVMCAFVLWIAAPASAVPQGNFPTILGDAKPSSLPPPVPIIDGIALVGLHHIPAGSVLSRLSVHIDDSYDTGRIANDVRVLNSLGWFEDISVKVVQVYDVVTASANPLWHVRLEFHLQEYPFLTSVVYTGAKLWSQQQIKKLLEDKKLMPRTGRPADPVVLHRVAYLLQSELAANGHRDARVLIKREPLPDHKTRVTFVIHEGPRQPVVHVNFSGHPEVPNKILRKQMREIAPDTWLSSFRNKNVYTPQKAEQDRLNLLTYLQNHGFPQARVGTPEPSLVNGFSTRSLPWFRHQPGQGLIVGVPIEAGGLYRFGLAEVSPALRQRLGPASKHDGVSPDVTAGRPFSEHAVQSLQRNWEMRLRHQSQRHKVAPDYRLRSVPTFDSATHLASVKFDFDPAPPYIVRRVDFRGNRRFPDRYLRRRIGLVEGLPFDEYALEAGLARLARTGYFEPCKKQDVEIATNETDRSADVTVHVREKGKQRLTFSGGREQFGSSLGIAYTVFNLLGLDEFLSTQIDGGPETLQLAIGLAKEGFFGSRGTLALSVFDTFVRPRFVTAVQGPFLRSETQGVNAGWTYALSDSDAIGINYGISRSTTEYALNTIPANSSTPATVRTDISSHSLGAGWMRYASDQKIQVTGSVSGSWLGGNENLLKSRTEYGRIFPDNIFGHHNAWAFRTSISAAGSYRGDLPLYARFLSGDDFVRGLRPGELGPYETFETISSSGAPTYSAVPTGANLVAASNLEYRFPPTHGVEGATFFDSGSGLLFPNWLGPTRPALIDSTNGVLHASAGVEVRWTVPGMGVPLRLNYSFNLLRLNRSFLMPDGSLFRVRNRLGAFGWGFGSLF